MDAAVYSYGICVCGDGSYMCHGSPVKSDSFLILYFPSQETLLGLPGRLASLDCELGLSPLFLPQQECWDTVHCRHPAFHVGSEQIKASEELSGLWGK